jgi:opacity protein-like surface antigen
MNTPLNTVIVIPLLCALAAPCQANDNAAAVPATTPADTISITSTTDDWNFEAAVYLWGASIGGETASGEDIDYSFSDLLSDLKFAGMAYGSASKGKWTVAADVIYLNVGTDEKNSRSGPLGLASVSTKAKVNLRSWVVEAVAGYRLVETDKVSLDFVAGARLLSVDVDVTLKAEGPLRTRKRSDSGSDSMIDAIVGVTGRYKLSPKWYLPYHLDAGTGQSKFTWQAMGGVGYHFDKLDVELDYRYLAWNFDNSSALKDLTLQGPLLGLRYHF